MSIDKDDNDNEKKNLDTYKALGDQMARFALNIEDKEKEEENSFLITYNDLAGKAPNLVSNPIKKTSTNEAKAKGKVQFSQVIKANTQNKRIDSKSNENINKFANENIQENQENNLPPINNNANHIFKNSNANAYIGNSIANTNTNSSGEKNLINGINKPNSNTGNVKNFNNVVIQNNRTNNIINPNKINNIDDSKGTSSIHS